MARILILGAGISGHTTARYLGKWVGKQHQELDSIQHLGGRG